MAGNGILQEDRVIKVGGREFTAPPLGTSTWVKISNYLDDLPILEGLPEVENLTDNHIMEIVNFTLHNARGFVPLVDALAVGITGYKHKYSLYQRFRIWRLRRWLALQPRNEIVEAVIQLINDADLARFFLNTTFLSKRSLTKPTKVV